MFDSIKMVLWKFDQVHFVQNDYDLEEEKKNKARDLKRIKKIQEPAA